MGGEQCRYWIGALHNIGYVWPLVELCTMKRKAR